MSLLPRLTDRIVTLIVCLIVSSVVIFLPVSEAIKLVILLIFSLVYGFLFLRPEKKIELPVEPLPVTEEVLEPEVTETPEAKHFFNYEEIEKVGLSLKDHLKSIRERWNSKNHGSKSSAVSEGESRKLELVTLKASSDFISENIMRAFEISDNLANTAKTAFELSESVQKGVKIVTSALSQSLSQTAILFEQSKQISKIIEIMSEISEKIHILSINASIVSARAGTAGKGFEVVAKEIRILAKETEKSLEEIEQVIVDVQGTITAVVEKVDTASKQTNNEQNNLMSVAGALQGVILAVEIIRAVTSVANEKAVEQKGTMESWITESEVSDEGALEVLDGEDIPEFLQQIDQDLETLKALVTVNNPSKENS